MILSDCHLTIFVSIIMHMLLSSFSAVNVQMFVIPSKLNRLHVVHASLTLICVPVKCMQHKMGQSCYKDLLTFNSSQSKTFGNKFAPEATSQ